MASLNIQSWSPSDVAQWIKGLGPQYESCSESFVDEEINGKALLTINTEYLTELEIKDENDQNAILDAVRCLIEVEACLQSETVHGQVIVISDQTKILIDKLEKESQESNGDVITSENSTKFAAQVYQLAKKLLSWLIRAPFSEMNACWPLKDSVTRVVRDMTDESLLKNREHLQENLKKLEASFNNFLKEEPLHEVFKQPPILVTEEFTLEGEGLGIGISTSHHIHTVNSVTAETPAEKNGNIKNGDEIVYVNGQCVISWPQKNVINLMRSNSDSVSLTLKKLPPVKGPLNKPPDKPGTPLSEMNVVMDRTKVAPERVARVEMKEAGIKEETSLEMQAIENENAAEENSKVEEKIEGIKEEEIKEEDKENEKKEAESSEKVPEKENVPADKKEEGSEQETTTKESETEVKTEAQKDSEEQASKEAVVENGEQETNEKEVKNNVEETVDKKEDTAEKAEDEKTAVVEKPEENVSGESESKPSAEEQDKAKDGPAVVGDGAKVEANGDVKEAGEEQEKVEEKVEEESDKKEDKVVNGEVAVTAPESENAEVKKTEEISEVKPKNDENKENIEIKVESPSPTKEPMKPTVTENSQKVVSEKEPPSPSKKPPRPDFRKMNIGSIKHVTVGGANTKQVEVYGNVTMRQKKPRDGAPSKRISCIELGEADCEGWLTKRSGGHGITPTRWRRQWCVLKEDHLYYYKTSFDREAGGVIDITGYKMSPAPEIKKPFAFKCEKERGKKYFFHADNEVDREMWIKALNMTARGERKQQEAAAAQMHEALEQKSGSLKPSQQQSNRPRTGSVLAGIRFNYYDDEDLEESRQIKQEPSTAERVNEGLFNGQKDDAKPSTEETAANENILKIAAGVEEDACQVVPVAEVEGHNGTETNDKGSSEETKCESQEKAIEEQPKDQSTTNVDKIEPKEDSPGTPEDKANEVSKSEDTTAPKEVVVNGDTKDEISTQEVKEEVKAADGDFSKDPAGTNEATADDQKNGQIETDECAGKEVEDKPENDSMISEDVTTKSENVINKSEDDTKASEGDATKSDDTTKSEDDATKPEVDATNSEDTAVKSEASVVDSKDSATKSEAEAETSEEKPKDEFQEIAESIKEAEVGIDGTEKSAAALLRKLSLTSQSEIMDKVIKLRVLKQDLKDKEHSIDAIDELLSSDVTPESIAEWRAKYETISNSDSNDLNENSSL